MKNGMLIYEKRFYGIRGLQGKTMQIKGQILDAIFKMTQTTMEQDISLIKLKGYHIVFKQTEKESRIPENLDNFLIYIVGDANLDTNESQKLLIQIIEIYFSKYHINTDSGIAISLDENSNFGIEVNKLIGDYYSTSLDRMENIFF
jgi:hypothetical protein